MAYGRKLVRDADREIGSLEKKAAKSSGEAKAQFQSDIQELKAKRAAASKSSTRWARRPRRRWDEAKNGFADAYKDLHDSYNKAVKKLK